MEKKEKLDALQLLDFSFRSKPFPAKQMLSCQNLTFGYDEQVPLISDFGITISAGERVCVVGKNGKGKTTLLKLLAQKLKPQSGQVKYHPAAVEGFFEQTNISSLIDDRTVEEEILYTHTDIDRQNARNICGAMMFSGDEALKKISVLSGGEKSRVMLGKLLATPVNLLLLDEPTNHLDMESCDAMLTAIDLFQGAVIMVTHNEMFLHSLAERLVVFQDEQINVFEGRYQEFLDAGGWHDEKPPGQQSTAPVQACLQDTRAGKKEMRRKRSDIISRRSKAVKPLENRISQLESDIESQEVVLQNLNQQMQQASQNREGTKIQKLSQSMHSCQTAIDELFDKLEKATDKLEAQKAEFDRELHALENGKEGEKVGG
jgi:ATP-binding cassette subfamily F protein 3